MSEESYLQKFTEYTLTYITSSLLEPICDWVKNNPDEEVTPDALISALSLPALVKTAGRSTPKIQPLATASTSLRRRRTTPTTRPQCKWVFIRGDREGEQCTAPAVDGYEYCSSCKHKKAAGGSGRSSGKAKPKGTAASTKGKLSSKPIPVEETPQEPELCVELLGLSTDGEELLRDPGTGFIIMEEGENHVLVGIYDDETKQMLDLEGEEREKACILLAMEYKEGVTYIPEEESY